MTTPAIIMLIVAVCTVWGGFIAAVLHLRRTPEVPDNDQGFGGDDLRPVPSSPLSPVRDLGTVEKRLVGLEPLRPLPA